MSSGVKRRPCGPVRQLSLQTSPSPAAVTSLAARRSHLRKQSSEDIWTRGGGPSPPLLCVGGSPNVSRSRPPPPPVRLAWTEQRRTPPQPTNESPKVEVEVVARKCALPQARSRTPQQQAKCVSQELDGSRLRLAERLRLAWQQQQQQQQQGTNSETAQATRARTNLDIFLAHNSVGARRQADQVQQVIPTSEQNYSTVFTNQNHTRIGGEEEREKERNHEKSLREKDEEDEELMRSRSFESRTEERFRNEEGNRIQEVDGSNNKEKEMKEGKSICISITDVIDDEVGRGSSRRNSGCSVSELEDDDDDGEVGERVVQQRLKSSRSKNVVRGVSSLTSSPDLVVNKKVDAYPGAGSGSRSSTPGAQQQLPRRLMSAPPQSLSKRPQEKSYSPQTSQPSRRKLKSGRRKQQKPEEEEDISSGDENIEQKPRRSRSARTSEVITMVSLLSPGQSEQEEDECTNMVLGGATDPAWQPDHPGGTTFIPTTATTTSSPFLNAGSTSVNPVLCIRKPVKTVSFQQQSGARSYANNFPSRRGAAILPGAESHNPAPPVLRSTSLVAPGATGKGGADVGAASLKRKLVRAKSSNEGTSMQTIMSNEDDEKNKPSCISNSTTHPIEILLTPAKNTTEYNRMDMEAKELDKRGSGSDKNKEEKEEEEEEAENDVPEFKTPKEQECWDLFRRMVDKGITVSFETVLRGMLTPTEYRLRRHNLLTS